MKVAVVGSGPTGVAATSALLAAGVGVDLFDVGHEPEPAADALARTLRAGDLSPATLQALQQSGPKTQQGIGAAIKLLLARQAPASMVAKTRLGSSFTFRDVEQGIPLDGHTAIPRSLARGGLSNVWGSACYPLRPEDYARWPIPETTMQPHFAAAAALLDLEETDDDLRHVYPLYTSPRADLPTISQTSTGLLDRWRRHADTLHAVGAHFGRARTAVRFHGEVAADRATDHDHDAGRVGCQRCGLCLWGCPWDAIYRSTRTWARLKGAAGLRQHAGHLVRHIEETSAGSFVHSHERHGPYDAVFLAAGPLSSLRIAVESLQAYGHTAPLLDNDMYLVPSVRGPLGGSRGDGGAFALSEAVLSLAGAAVGGQAMHLQLYAYGEFLSRNVRTRLRALPNALARVPATFFEQFIVAFFYMHSDDSVVATATVVPNPAGSRLEIAATPNARSRTMLRRAISLVRRHPRAFGFVPLPMTALSTTVGFSGHLCGTLPMRPTPRRLESHLDGRIEGTRALFAVDASAFPILPSQNLTYSAMANAHRIASGFARR
jgi:choline dehydrogenase-like flavoprotein